MAYLSSVSLKNLEKLDKRRIKEEEASGPSVDASTVHRGVFRNGLSGKVAVKKPFINEKTGIKDKLCKNWTENLSRPKGR